MKNHFKTHILSFLILLLFSTSCSLTDSVCKDGQGDVISQERTISGFTAIESRGSFIVNIFQDSSIKEQSITISAQENIIELIQTRLVGQSLVIDNDECYNTNEEVTITVRTPALSQIVLTGSGDIILQDTIRKSEIEFILDGSGSIQTTPSFPIIASTNCIARIKGSGTMELDFNSTTIVNASVDGSGTITLKGEARANNLNISGSGNIKAFNMPVLTSTVELLGSGIIELTANDSDSTLITSRATVDAQISGSGTVRVKGNAAIRWNVSGSGKIERVE
ncbi:head GIN domain-containing protein [Bernardetia sp. OM2101]|uniref:head GIN domain-containing protein n=1 Tax=Bernardetia sp. OM2101 TaxID=3344876 RepID=UPI0035CF94B6